MKQLDRDRLWRYERRNGFLTGRDRISIPAFPLSQLPLSDGDDFVSRPGELAHGKRWPTVIDEPGDGWTESHPWDELRWDGPGPRADGAGRRVAPPSPGPGRSPRAAVGTRDESRKPASRPPLLS